ncbi:MAG: hypothetical protein L0220_32620 [Acidobacteria bacterium]|nr:hypothetical protein [Acidobacteriota bacterium]
MSELDWKQPALFGGVIIGVLSATPGVNLVNCCFCGWALIGGAVAAKMLINRTPRPIKMGEGATIGVMAGLIGVVIFGILNSLLALSGVATRLQVTLLERLTSMVQDPAFQDQLREALQQQLNMSAAERLISSLPILILYGAVLLGFTVLGGVLGVALFEKRKDTPPPVPPQYPPQYPPPVG